MFRSVEKRVSSRIEAWDAVDESPAGGCREARVWIWDAVDESPAGGCREARVWIWDAVDESPAGGCREGLSGAARRVRVTIIGLIASCLSSWSLVPQLLKSWPEG